ncbi:hypothetical protein CAPTEDRAFT_198389 [Capitella teleta]|uniref:Adenosine 3'-phospho 5'-phosphosulfate transporter 1 n=1 Tax=Capitella teleta TaxID=283909 RepID=R7UIL4_CAPTE|nr:hypothetical protein CAPTEDRAFT_198389 [Capitella teleta]|eukprot:ELU06404.1 hypothetical protein CAPTEDRAFT_198389 [Capitella teleta]
MLPGYLLTRWVRNSKYLERAGELFYRRKAPWRKGERSLMCLNRNPRSFLELCSCCSVQLVCSPSTSHGACFRNAPWLSKNFKNSQFLVFVNRILALVVAMIIINVKQQPRHRAPLCKYSFGSLSNIMSSWFQYEALKFVSFPVQVLGKASKVIPVMLMGKLISKRSYDTYEYLTAAMISLGVSMFLLTSGDAVHDDDKATTFSGVIILLGYLLFDAFTSNWQEEIFKAYEVSSLQMMAGVNFFSVIFTGASFVAQGGFVESLAFMARHSDFLWHSILLSICSAVGQLFIFHTISQFGAAFAILLSCIIYSHPYSSPYSCGHT